jgi:glycosyltransferase involved in cell wall biosynthesis
VVVCGFTEDRWDDLCRAVRSLHEQTEQAWEIILVVDHCPGLLRRAQENLSDVTIVPNRLAKGLAGGRNTGMAEAHGDVVAFMDDDAAADPDWLARLADHYQDARVIGVGGLVKPAWEAGRPRWFPPELDWVVGCSYLGMPVRLEPVRNFIGANMSFRREILADLHGFSIGLGRVGTTPLGCEETEFCLRLSQRYPDGVLLYEPAASVNHRVREQRARWGYLWSRCYAEGLSKAKVARLTDAGRALASERSYVRSTIPRGVGRSLADAARGRLAGLASALALVLAVVLAGVGYVVGRAARPSADRVTIPAPVPADVQVIRRASRHALVPWVGLTVCLGLWVIGLSQIDVNRVITAHLGLVSVLPVTFWVAVGVLMVSFCLAVMQRSTRWPVLAAHLLALVAIFHATPVILYGTLRYAWAWKHIGVVDYIMHYGVNFRLNDVLGVYQGWPGFFALSSFLTSGAGQASALSWASWALPVNNLLWLGPVILIARAFTSDQRLVWTAAWLFELCNWVGQDYFSPQAFSFFLYLTVIAICLRWLWDPRPSRRPVLAGPAARHPGRSPGGWLPAPGPRITGVLRLRRAPLSNGAADSGAAASRSGPDTLPPGTNPQVSRATRLVLVACLLPLMVAIASSHQLTPFMLIAALTLLAVFRQVRPRVLPVVMAVVTAGWIAYGALPWLTANRSQIFKGFGSPWANTSHYLVGQLQIPFDQILVDWVSRATTAAIAVGAVIGFWRYWRHHDAQARKSWTRVVLLALAAPPMAAASDYGGEVIFRVFLFALPFLAVATAAAFFPRLRTRSSAWLSVTLVGAFLALATGFILSNYANEAMNYFSPKEVAASEFLYRTAPQGAQVIGINGNAPRLFVNYNWYLYTSLDSPASVTAAVQRAPVATVLGLAKQAHGHPTYLILTKSQAAEVYLTGEWAPGVYSRVVHDLLASGLFRAVYHNSDATVLFLAQPRCRSSARTCYPPSAAPRPVLSPQVRTPLAAASNRLTGTRSQSWVRSRCLIQNNPAQFWLAQNGGPARSSRTPSRLLAQIPVAGQAGALARNCR